jgi:hypothetical protein
VQAGDLIGKETLPEVTYRASGPQTGAPPLDIMQGFILAATNPQDDYAVARLFLDDSIRADWKPNEIAQIRSGVGVSRQESDTEYSYSLTSSAYVNDRGQYFEGDPTSQVLDFSFAQNAEGEWRITKAPDGIVLSQDAFDSTFGAYPLYYFDPSNNYLVPDLRWFAKTTRLTTRIVSALLEGQSSWLTQGVTNTYFPTGTTLASSVTIDTGVATVDLDETTLDAPAEQRELMRQQLRATIGTVSDVVLTVNGVAIDVPETTAAPATIHPQVEGQLLVRRDDSFGFLTSGGSVSGLAGQSAEVIRLGATDATLARDKQATAVLAPDGVHLVFASNADPVLLDNRAGLIAPAIDNAGFVWTVPASDATAIRAYDSKGTAYVIDGAQFAGRAISLSISRDGARVLILVATDTGPRLYVAGIVRREGVPAQLGAAVSLAIDPRSIGLDAAWVDENTVASLTGSNGPENTTVTLYTLGGPSSSVGRIAGGVAIVGGNGGADGLRALTSDGEVFLPRGNGWADTSTKVTFMATQQ